MILFNLENYSYWWFACHQGEVFVVIVWFLKL
jgi:hypothetical protein